jgi:hypothetical protein
MGCALAAGLLLAGLLGGELLARALTPANPLSDHGLYADDPDLGWRLTPGHRHVGPQGEVVEINSHGLRDPERPREKPPGVRRVLVLGDSFTFGSALAAEDGFCRRLERRLGPGVEVIDAGVPRYSTAHEARWLERDGLAWSPDVLVVAFFVGNDPWENLVGIGGHALRVRDGELVEHDRRERSAWRELRNRSRLYRLLKQLPRLLRDRLAGEDPLERAYHELEAERLAVCLRAEGSSWVEAWTRTREALERIRALAGPRPVVLLLVPDEFQVDARLRAAVCARYGLDEAAYDLDRPQARLAALAGELGFHVVDPLPELRRRTEAGERLYLPLDSHWNAAGNQVAAEALAAAAPIAALAPP